MLDEPALLMEITLASRGAACRLLCTPGTWPGGPARPCTPTQRGRSARARLAARTGVPRPGWPQPPIRLLPGRAPCVMPPARRPQPAHDRAAGFRDGARAGECV